MIVVPMVKRWAWRLNGFLAGGWAPAAYGRAGGMVARRVVVFYDGQGCWDLFILAGLGTDAFHGVTEVLALGLVRVVFLGPRGLRRGGGWASGFADGADFEGRYRFGQGRPGGCWVFVFTHLHTMFGFVAHLLGRKGKPV